MKFSIEQVNDVSVLIRFGDSIDINLPAAISSANIILLNHFAELITDTVPAYTTLLVNFDDNAIEPPEFIEQIEKLLSTWQMNYDPENSASGFFSGREILIPVYYDPEVAPDLEALARQKQLSVEQVVQIHCGTIYTVYAIGFAPGFAFLGDVDDRIAAPRLPTPRQNVAKGSIGIAGMQTGIYPRSSPGGWNIIGRTPTEMFFPDESMENLCPLKIGDHVKFNSISRAEFLSLGGHFN